MNVKLRCTHMPEMPSGWNVFTEGKEYDVIGREGRLYTIKDDRGHLKCLSPNDLRFIVTYRKLSAYREQPLHAVFEEVPS